jgi:uncharacterized Zn finger protein
MSIEEVWGNFFKSEIKTSGSKLFAQEKVSVPSGSDTSIQAYVKVAPPIKVRFSATDIGAESFVAECTCPVARKNQFCKHVWATLLCVESKYPDFLSAKRVIEKPGQSLDAQGEPPVSFQAASKARAADYRKEQYQKQKLRAKELKRERKGPGKLSAVAAFPPAIETALAYFTQNGFPMPDGPSEAVLGEAKRKLSRVFHPDKGGNNDEVVELNHHCDLLLRYLRG